MADLLSDDEVDALMEDKADGESLRVELGRGGQRFRAWQPHFQAIDQRIATAMAERMFGLLHKPAEVESRDLQLLPFGEYLQGMRLPTSLNICSLSPLQGYLLVSLDANLVYSLVDSFFGGAGHDVEISGREFSKTELAVSALVLELMATAIRTGWNKVRESNFELLGTETNPATCNAFGAGELMVLRRFKLDLSGGGGTVDLLSPASAVDALLNESVAALPRPAAGPFLQQRAHGFKATVSGELSGASLSLRELLSLSRGDIIPVDSPEQLEVKVNGVTKFRARMGEKGGRVGLCILESVPELQS